MEKDIQQALINIQRNLHCPKNQFNSYGGYKYRNCEDILEAVKPLLAENGCFLTLSDEVVPIGDRVYVHAEASLRKGNEYVITSAYAREEEKKKGMDGAQITGSASSYARKYALNGLFCIDDVKDPDTSGQPFEAKDEPKRDDLLSPNQQKIIAGYPEKTITWVKDRYHVGDIAELKKSDATAIIKTMNAKKKEQEDAMIAEEARQAFEGV